jgi:ribosome-binding factor A
LNVRHRKQNHKDLQLCRQAYRTLSLALSGGCGDDVLAGLIVRAVLPAPDATRLLVWLELNSPVTDVADVLNRLERLKPMLRREVAHALVRKRAPELEFAVVPPAEVRA